ncbi:MAG: histidinol-phosphate transaminase [Opitutales bacterium]|nr:histidinol-phosphate transaminase [Opitutales bacterium]
MKDIVKEQIKNLPVYETGKPIEYVAREFGLDPDGILKMASNENPLGASPKALEALKSHIDTLNYYPDGGCYELRQKLSKFWNLQPNQFAFGNGSNELLEFVAQCYVDKGDETVFGAQSFIVYKLATIFMGGKCVSVPMPNLRYDLDMLRDAITDKTKIVFMTNPNNPTGCVLKQDEVVHFVKSLPENVIFCYDEAYAEYEHNQVDLRPLIAEGRNVICLRTFSKIYGLAGLRIGYAYTNEQIAGYINRAREPFNVNSLAQVAALAALDDVEFVAQSRKLNDEGRKQFENAFEQMGVEYFSEGGNFVMVKHPKAVEAFVQMQKQGVIVRPNVGYGLPEWLRITIGKPEQNQRCLEELKKTLS